MRDLLIKDWGWKLFSLILAAGIWWTVHKIIDPKNTDVKVAGQTITYDNLPVTVVAEAADVRNFRVNPATVKATVSGPADIMNFLKIGDVHAVVNLSGTNLAGDSRIPVEISAPANVTITAIDPPVVLVIAPAKPEIKP